MILILIAGLAYYYCRCYWYKTKKTKGIKVDKKISVTNDIEIDSHESEKKELFIV